MQRSVSHVLNPQAIAALIIGILITAAAVVMVRSQNDHRTREWVEDRGRAVAASTDRTFDDVLSDLQAIAAFVELSDGLTLERFREFVSATETEAGFLGIAYIEVVGGPERASYEAAMRSSLPGFELWELDGARPLSSVPRDVHLPVVFYSSAMVLTAADDPSSALTNDEPIGFDTASLSASAFLLDSLDEPTIAVSDYLEVPELEIPGRAIVLRAPVIGPGGDLEGFVVAASLDALLVPLLATGPVAEEVSWTIGPVGSTPASDLEWRAPVAIPDRAWELVVTPADPASASRTHLSVPGAIAVGTAFTILLVAAVALYRLRAQARLRAETLESLADEKGRFIATVSHELRTPLTSVSGLVSELHDRWTEFDPAEAIELLGLAKAEALEMAAIVEDLLVAARLEESRLTLRPVLIDLAEQYEAAVSGTGVEAAQPAGVTAFADPARVRQILRNLLTNARRYGGSRIEVTAESIRGLAVFEVLDDGPPIPKDERTRIFEPFTSAHPEGASLQSIGLGLYISRRLALSMGGDLAYEHDGTWSRFQLVLPAHVPPATEPEPAEEPEPALSAR